MYWKPVVFILVAILTIVETPWADVFVVKPNNQIIGTLVGQNDAELVINSFGTELRIRRADVIEIIPGDTLPMPSIPEVASPTPTSATPSETPLSNLTFPGTQTQEPAPVTPMTTEPENAPLLPVLLPQGEVYTVTGFGVSFRRGPSLEYDVITRLQSRDLLLGLETIDGWLRGQTIARQPQEGWIHPSFIQPMENTPTLVNAARVNVRETPDLVGRIVGRINEGDVVLKLEERDDWWRILLDETTAGWCKAEFLQPLDNPQLYRPAVTVTDNRQSGMPVLLETFSNAIGQARYVFTLRDERLVRSGMTNLLVMYTSADKYNNPEAGFSSEAILNRTRFSTSEEIQRLGIPQEIAARYAGIEAYTLLGQRVEEGWRYELNGISPPGMVFGFMVQRSEARGTLITVEPAQ